MPIYLVILVSVVAFLNLSCKKTITDPHEETPQGGRRDYIWTEDTLKVGYGFQVLAVRMWGTSPDNFWVTTQSDYLHNLWHYDGDKIGIDSILRPILDPWGIFGFSTDDIWLASSDGEIWHFNGKEWSKYGNYKKEGYKLLVISNFSGTSPQDIYGVGSAWKDNDSSLGVILHFDGNEWTFVDIPETNFCFSDIKYQASTDTYYVQGYLYGPPEIGKFYSFKENNLKEIFTTDKLISLNNIGDKVYFIIGKQVYKTGNVGLELWKDYSNEVLFNRIWGTSETNIFHMTGAGVAHYNGTNLQVLHKTNIYASEALIFETEVFFLGQNFNTWENIIIHGKLKEDRD